jgi:hypothetical protein
LRVTSPAKIPRAAAFLNGRLGVATANCFAHGLMQFCARFVEASLRLLLGDCIDRSSFHGIRQGYLCCGVPSRALRTKTLVQGPIARGGSFLYAIRKRIAVTVLTRIRGCDLVDGPSRDLPSIPLDSVPWYGP